ncbi:MAG: hypothetical protein QW407_02690 [Thermofilaceae archaeon]
MPEDGGGLPVSEVYAWRCFLCGKWIFRAMERALARDALIHLFLHAVRNDKG